MKRKSLTIRSVLLSWMIGLLILSCSNDDDDIDIEPTIPPLIGNKWTIEDIYIDGNELEKARPQASIDGWIIFKNSFEYEARYRHYDDNDFKGQMTVEGKYEINDEKKDKYILTNVPVLNGGFNKITGFGSNSMGSWKVSGNVSRDDLWKKVGQTAVVSSHDSIEFNRRNGKLELLKRGYSDEVVLKIIYKME